MRFPRQEYWSELSFPSPGDLPDPGIEPTSPVSPAFSHQVSPHTYIFFQIAFYFGLQDTECSFLLHTMNPCCLSILYIVVVYLSFLPILFPVVTVILFSMSVRSVSPV